MTRSAALLTALALECSPGSVNARAAPDGAMGAVSRTGVAISVSTAPRIEALRVQHAQAAGRQSLADGAHGFCIWSNAALRTFTVSASDIGPNDPASRAGRARYAYQLQWRDDIERSKRVDVREGAEISGTAPPSSGACERTQLIVAPGAGANDEGEASVLLLIAPE